MYFRGIHTKHTHYTDNSVFEKSAKNVITSFSTTFSFNNQRIRKFSDGSESGFGNTTSKHSKICSKYNDWALTDYLFWTLKIVHTVLDIQVQGVCFRQKIILILDFAYWYHIWFHSSVCYNLLQIWSNDHHF